MNILSSKNKESKIQHQFLDILLFESDDEKLEFEAQMIHLDLMAKIKELMTSKKIENKKQLADLLNTSPSYITQLFSGEKLANFKLLAKLQRALDTKFSIVPDQYMAQKRNFRNRLAQKGYDKFEFGPENPNNGFRKIA
ncbi:MAG: helix-turn-helix transcriptional regulator [Chlorobi bacterium]|nr:helix-turn-helix transcriptional regulator [Chlorobiota bacterium]